MEARSPVVTLSNEARAKIATSPLHLAVLQNNVEMVKSLVASGANIKSVNLNNQTAFELACELGYYDCAEQFEPLLSNFIDKPDGKYGRLYLYAASHNECIELLKKLHQAGVSTEAVTRKEKYTALHQAVVNYNTKAVDFLLSAGASLTAGDQYGKTPLRLACSKKIWWIVDSIISHLKTKELSADELEKLGVDDTLEDAVRYKRRNIVKSLLELGSLRSLTKQDALFGNNILWLAIYECDDTPEILMLLLEHGADPNICNVRGESMYDIAAQSRNKRSADILSRYVSGVAPHVMKGFMAEIQGRYQQLLSPDTNSTEVLANTILYFAMIHDLFSYDVKALKAKRNTLALHGDENRKEIDSIDNQIISLQRLQQYPDDIENVDDCLQNTEAGTHVADHLKRMEHIRQYHARVKEYLRELKDNINDTDWQVKSFFESFTNKFHSGTPKHIGILKAVLDKLTDHSSMIEVLATYSVVSGILHEIKPDRCRHHDTSEFYKREIAKIDDMHFLPRLDVVIARSVNL